MSTTCIPPARHIRTDDIPEEYRDIVDAIGMEAFVHLTLLCGGQTLYVPKRESLEAAPAIGTFAPCLMALTTEVSRPNSALASVRSERSSTAAAADGQITRRSDRSHVRPVRAMRIFSSRFAKKTFSFPFFQLMLY